MGAHLFEDRQVAPRAILLAFALLLGSCGGSGNEPSPADQTTPTPVASSPPEEQKCDPRTELCWPEATPSEIEGGSTRPRVILSVMLDDADYNDFGYYSLDAVTPGFDRAARRGVVLSRYYSASAICSPTRASMITGNSPLRYGLNRLWPNLPRRPGVTDQYYTSQRGLPESAPSIARELKKANYTAFHVGKWHLGLSKASFSPTGVGFDDFRVTRNLPFEGNISVQTPEGLIETDTKWRARYEADTIIDFLEESLDSGEDVYINWWPIDPHTIRLSDGSDGLYVPPTFNLDRFNSLAAEDIDTSSNRGKLLSMMFALDAEFSRVTSFLNQRGVLDDTLIVVTSDNGGWRNALSPTRPITGAKGTFDEGGIRVPFLLSWPSRIQGGAHSDLPMQSADVFPTILGLVGIPTSARTDGRDLSSLFLQGTSNRGPMFFEMRQKTYRVANDEKTSDLYALIDGCNKAISKGGTTYYFNVCSNPLERLEDQLNDQDVIESLALMMKEERLAVSLLVDEPSVSRTLRFEHDERFNIHQDDISIYAEAGISASDTDKIFNVYRRGDGVKLEIAKGELVATLTGAATADLAPEMKTVRLSATMPADGLVHEIGLVVRGYLRGASSISLFIDGRRVAANLAPVNQPRIAGNSILAVKNETVPAFVGDPGLSLRNLRIFTNALEPGEL